MATYPTQIHPATRRGQPNNTDNVVFQPMVNNSDRYQPSVEYGPPSTITASGKPAAAMYTSGNNHQPIPPQYVPTKTDPGVYYVNSRRAEQQPLIQQNREVPLLHPPQGQPGTTIVFPESQAVPQPVLYSIVGGKPPSIANPPISISKEQPASTLYLVNNRPHTFDTNDNNVHISTSTTTKFPTLYSLVDNARPRADVPEPPKQTYLQPSYAVQANKPNPVQPAPPQSSRDPAVYTLHSEPRTLKVQEPHSAPMAKPTMYSLVARQSSPRLYENAPKLPATVLMTAPQTDRSLQRKVEVVPEEIILQPAPKTRRHAELKEPLIPKPEFIVYPAADNEHHAYPFPAHQAPVYYQSPEQSPRKSNIHPQQVTIQVADPHRSVTTNQTHRPYYEQRSATTHISPVRGRSRSYAASQTPRVKKYPVTTIRTHLRSWDSQYHIQTNDDDDYERKLYKQNEIVKPARPRWIPAW